MASTQRGGGGKGAWQIFEKLVNKNAIKLKLVDPPPPLHNSVFYFLSIKWISNFYKRSIKMYHFTINSKCGINMIKKFCFVLFCFARVMHACFGAIKLESLYLKNIYY